MMLTFFQKNSRGIFLILFGLLGLALGTFCAALLGLFLQPSEVIAQKNPADSTRQIKKASLNDYQAILSRDIFNSSGGQLTFVPTPTRRTGRTSTAPSDWQLVGTISGGPTPLATLRGQGETLAYRLNSELPDGSTLSRVERNRVTITRQDGRKEELMLPEESASGASRAPAATSPQTRRSSRRAPPVAGGGIRSLGNNRWQIAGTEAEKARGNIGELLKQARIEPNLTNGQTDGFMVKMIQPGTLLSQLGLQVGDILHEINGVPLDSPEKALQIFQQLRQARQVNIALERSGAPMTFSYEIE